MIFFGPTVDSFEFRFSLEVIFVFFHIFTRIHGIRLIHVFSIFQDFTEKNDEMNWKYISCNARFIWADFHFCIGICNQIQIDERIRSQDTQTQLESMALYQKIAKFIWNAVFNFTWLSWTCGSNSSQSLLFFYFDCVVFGSSYLLSVSHFIWSACLMKWPRINYQVTSANKFHLNKRQSISKVNKTNQIQNEWNSFFPECENDVRFLTKIPKTRLKFTKSLINRKFKRWKKC